MNLSKHFIIINDQPKTFQIDFIYKDETFGYKVRFKNSPKIYNYSYYNVRWLSNPLWIDPTHSKVFINGTLQKQVKEIWKFESDEQNYLRIIFNNNFILDDVEGNILVTSSCLEEKESKDTFSYLRNVAYINPLGKADHSNGILRDMYDKCDFIGDDTAAACYLNPKKHKPKAFRKRRLIYPFGCNSSQKKAVCNAFKHQISVIQGPPGTGKTQTILNIISNIVLQGKTVMVVSNNNSATTNVQEKLEKYGLSFIVAPLGSKENKERFIENQPSVPSDISVWDLPKNKVQETEQELISNLEELDQVFALQNERALLLQESQTIKLEWKHFCIDNNIDEGQELTQHLNAKSILSAWLKCQAIADNVIPTKSNMLSKLFENLKWLWLKWAIKHKLHINRKIKKEEITELIKQLQTLYYLNRSYEVNNRIEDIEKELSNHDAKALTNSMTHLSLSLFKNSLCQHYQMYPRIVFADTKAIRHQGEDFLRQYPVVLSTTFSSRSCLFTEKPYDYLIMDEASQVSIDTSALALTCAKNIVVVGDTLQLPNVVTDEDKVKLDTIFKQYNLNASYDCTHNCFLQSIMKVIENVPSTLLREHYRCHPHIINFCNQKFYGGNLLIMTEDKGEENVLSAIRTTEGNHAANQYNQREIDVVKEEVLPSLKNYDSIGIITPYNNQVNAFNRQLDDVKAATIHKYQGREKDAIIMSVVDNQITPFADDSNMLNVAVSRAKKKFVLVLTGNKQEQEGNITDLIHYIAYNNCTITDSKLASIFDYLYEQYTEQRIEFLKSHPQVSEYASENLAYSMLNEVLTSNDKYSCLNVLSHMPLRQVVQDTSLMTEEELKYASNYSTHIDFLIINRVTKQPIMAIETDGYSYHNESTEQHQKDMMKDHILACYGLPLLRLSTKGSNESERVSKELDSILYPNPTDKG